MERRFSIENPSTVESLHKIATILETGLDKKEIKIILELIDLKVDPESIADVIRETRLFLASAVQS
jgi:Mitotic-spindle organizing gamma-tubulin ring associated